MTNVFDVSGNNLPEITVSTPAKEVLNVCHQIITRKRNSFEGFIGDDGTGAMGYNKAILELEDELYRLLNGLEAGHLKDQVFNNETTKT